MTAYYNVQVSLSIETITLVKHFDSLNLRLLEMCRIFLGTTVDKEVTKVCPCSPDNAPYLIHYDDDFSFLSRRQK